MSRSPPTAPRAYTAAVGSAFNLSTLIAGPPCETGRAGSAGRQAAARASSGNQQVPRGRAMRILLVTCPSPTPFEPWSLEQPNDTLGRRELHVPAHPSAWWLAGCRPGEWRRRGWEVARLYDELAACENEAKGTQGRGGCECWWRKW